MMVLTYSHMHALGTPIPDFKLPATDGRTLGPADVAGPKGLLVVFTCNHCPYAKAVQDRLAAIARDYGPAGIGMVLINSNDATTHPDDSFEKMKELAEAKDLGAPYLYDETQDVARAFKAACTPDPFLFDAEGKLYYRGRIDDNWQAPEKVTRRELREALDALIAGRPAPEQQMPSLGCNVKWKA